MSGNRLDGEGLIVDRFPVLLKETGFMALHRPSRLKRPTIC